MKPSPRLLFYVERETSFNNKIRSKFFEYSLPFIEIRDGEELANALSSHKFNIIMRLDSQYMYDRVSNIISEENLDINSFMIIHENPCFTIGKYPSTCNIDEITKHLLFLATNNIINLQPLEPSIIQKILAMEMENIGISKSYIGFKYLLDLLVLSVNDKEKLLSLNEKFEKISLINNINKECIERDLRHMLNSCWRNSDIFRNALLNTKGEALTINFKNLLYTTLEYFIELF